jgi:hypothetical protein
MATIVAVRSGNWSDTSHETGPWPGGSTPTTKPGIGDTVQTDGFPITIDEDVHVALLESTSTGYFVVTDAPTLPAVRTITANVLNSGTATGAIQISNATGQVFLTGDVTGGSEVGANGIYSAGTIGDVTGDVTGGAGDSAIGIYNSGVIGNITGDIAAGNTTSAYGIQSTSTIGNIIGDISGSNWYDACGIFNDGGTIGDITGDIIGSAGVGAYGIYSTGNIGDITGNVTGGGGKDACGIYTEGAIGDITGNVTGGGGDDAYGVESTSRVDIDGVLACGPTGVVPVAGAMRLVASAANAMSFLSTVGAAWTLSNDYPAEADVKSGVDYNRGTMTGELAAGGNIGPVSIVIGGGGIRIS